MTDCLEVLVCQRCGRDVVLGGTAGHVCVRCLDEERKTLRAALTDAHRSLRWCNKEMAGMRGVVDSTLYLLESDVENAARLLTRDEQEKGWDE